MFEELEQKKQEWERGLTIKKGYSPVLIEVRPESPSIIHYENNVSEESVCVGCLDTPCIKYDSEEFASELPGFLSDASRDTCSINAIAWDDENSVPIINQDECISCGVCIHRCPTKAIYLTTSGAVINKADNLVGFLHANSDEDIENTIKVYREVKLRGVYGADTEGFFRKGLQAIIQMSNESNILRPNLLVRNLLRSIGYTAQSRRHGVQYNTTDIMLEHHGTYFVFEVEVGSSAIDQPRDLAGDVAVLVGRHGIAYGNVLPVSVLFSLPRKREEYWNVVNDMRQVLNLQIRTVTIFLLIICVLFRLPLNLFDNNLIIDSENADLRKTLQTLLGREPNLGIGWLGLLEPEK